MTRRTTIPLSMIFLGVLALMGTGCRRQTEETARKFGFDEFVPIYNRYIENWIKAQQLETVKELARAKSELSTADADAAGRLHARIHALEKDQEKWKFRLSLGDYLKTGDPSEIPTDLVWRNGMDQPEIGDPAAKKGGVLRFYQPTFPPTLRPFGDNSNNGFRNYIHEDISLTMVMLHPETMKEIPALAKEWAVSKDNRTVYFRIDPEARYSDGRPVRAKDFQIGAYIRVSDYIVNPYQKQYYRENIAQIAMYDDLTLSVSLPESVLYTAYIAGGIEPASPDFYAEYGPDYSERYQWRFPPTTGAYDVRPEDIVKGTSILPPSFQPG
jgi:microcin C transport system substrate-binding protein